MNANTPAPAAARTADNSLEIVYQIANTALPLTIRVDMVELFVLKFGVMPLDMYNLAAASIEAGRAAAPEVAYASELYEARVFAHARKLETRARYEAAHN